MKRATRCESCTVGGVIHEEEGGYVEELLPGRVEDWVKSVLLSIYLCLSVESSVYAVRIFCARYITLA